MISQAILCKYQLGVRIVVRKAVLAGRILLETFLFCITVVETNLSPFIQRFGRILDFLPVN